MHVKEGDRMEFEKACSQCFDYFVEYGKHGVATLMESSDAWIFIGANATKGVTDYDMPPIIIRKKDGKCHFMSFTDDEDIKIFDTAIEIKVPDKYQAKY